MFWLSELRRCHFLQIALRLSSFRLHRRLVSMQGRPGRRWNFLFSQFWLSQLIIRFGSWNLWLKRIENLGHAIFLLGRPANPGQKQTPIKAEQIHTAKVGGKGKNKGNLLTLMKPIYSKNNRRPPFIATNTVLLGNALSLGNHLQQKEVSLIHSYRSGLTNGFCEMWLFASVSRTLWVQAIHFFLFHPRPLHAQTMGLLKKMLVDACTFLFFWCFFFCVSGTTWLCAHSFKVCFFFTPL